MKKVYEQPTLAIEDFVTEEVMAYNNAFASKTYVMGETDWKFLETGESGSMGNVLQSVDFSDFNN
ncbi:MAG: hypothetical protein IKR46_01855 [Clostridia bacterium]|nr:hypothetical protein [Clostridia bacterium]